MDEPDFNAHMTKAAPPKRNGGRAFLDRWTGELIRLLVAVVVSLAVSYYALSQTQHTLEHNLGDFCRAQTRIVENQRTVLLSLLRLIDDLAYDLTPGSDRPNQLTTREKLLQALAVLPDEINC